MAESAGEKTEKATPKRKQDERKKGNVFSSKDFAAAFFILILFLTLKIAAPFMYENLARGLKDFISISSDFRELTNESLKQLFISATKTILLVTGPIFIVGIAAPVIFTGIQTKFLFSMSAIKPKFSRLNPIEGIKKLFSLRSLVELFKNLLKLAVISAIIYNEVSKRMKEIISLFDVSPKLAIPYVASAIFSAVIVIAIIFVFLGIFDIGYQWWEYEKNLKMTKQEVKEEYKQMEGDPQIKGKIKQKQREMSQARMMQEVPTADVIIRNPTHFAIAIRYDVDKDFAPKVVAKGQDRIALKIIDIATEHNITCTENKPLARALYESVDLGREIPEKFYHEVAEILAFVYDLKNKMIR